MLRRIIVSKHTNKLFSSSSLHNQKFVSNSFSTFSKQRQQQQQQNTNQDEQHVQKPTEPQQKSFLQKFLAQRQSFFQKYGRLGLVIYSCLYLILFAIIFGLLYIQDASIIPLYQRLHEWEWISDATMTKIENLFVSTSSGNLKSQIFIAWITTELLEPLRISLTILFVSFIMKNKLRK